MQFIQCHIVGDELVGKSSLITRYTDNIFEKDTTIKDDIDDDQEITDDFNLNNVVKEFKVNDHTVKLSILKTECKEGLEHLRLTSYKQADVFLICFSLVK